MYIHVFIRVYMHTHITYMHMYVHTGCPDIMGRFETCKFFAPKEIGKSFSILQSEALFSKHKKLQN